jgi:hypothetical protein
MVTVSSVALAPSSARLTWRTVALWSVLGLGVAANLAVVAVIWLLMARGWNEQDWNIFAEAGRRAWSGVPLYDWTRTYEYRYSPLLAYLFGLIEPIGIVGWRIMSLASLLLLPRRLALVALISIPLWLDLYAGNTMTIVLVLAILALAGKPWAIGGFLITALLIPRPLMLPVMAWLLWKHPEWRWRFVGLAAAQALLVLMLGSGDDWLRSFLVGRSDLSGVFDFGPSRIIGWVWIPIGLVLAAWATWKGRLGYASLAASPYWLPYYPLMLLLELRPRSAAQPAGSNSASSR